MRITVVHPPWFDDETNDLGVVYFRDQRFQAVALRADELPGDPARMRPEPIVDWVCGNLPDEAEAVFLGGNIFHAAAAVEPLERRTGRLVSKPTSGVSRK
jgi:maleate isomerase